MWRLAAKKPLTEIQWRRCFKGIPKQLDKLWNLRRIEDHMARKKHLPSPEIIGDIFHDYLERARKPLTGAFAIDFDAGYEIEIVLVPKPEPAPKESHEFARKLNIDDLVKEVLYEVLTELRQETLEHKRANLRRWMHDARLSELHARRGVLT